MSGLKVSCSDKEKLRRRFSIALCYVPYWDFRTQPTAPTMSGDWD
jgi:hypothetical protein